MKFLRNGDKSDSLYFPSLLPSMGLESSVSEVFSSSTKKSPASKRRNLLSNLIEIRNFSCLSLGLLFYLRWWFSFCSFRSESTFAAAASTQLSTTDIYLPESKGYSLRLCLRSLSLSLPLLLPLPLISVSNTFSVSSLCFSLFPSASLSALLSRIETELDQLWIWRVVLSAALSKDGSVLPRIQNS